MTNRHLSHTRVNQNPSHREVFAWRRLWDSRSAVVFVYLYRFAFAFSLASPFAAYMDISSHRSHDSAQTAEGQNLLLLVESARKLLPTIREQSLLPVGITLLYCLLIPLVSMVWIYAIDEPRSLQTNVIQAARRYHASLLISIIFLFALLATTALLFGLGWAAYHGLSFIPNDRIRDTICFAAVLPGSLLVLYLVVSFDNARTALCRYHSAFSAIQVGLTTTFRTKCILSFLFWFGFAALLTGVSVYVFAFQENCIGQSLFLSFTAFQIISFTRTVLRGRWLVSARNSVDRLDEQNIRKHSFAKL